VLNAVILVSAIAWPSACIQEEMTPFGPALDALWSRAIALVQTPDQAGAPTADDRPRFCFVPTPLWRGNERILGGFDREAGAAAILLTPEELPHLGRCVIVHEMLHALLGPGREREVRRLARCPEAERLGVDTKQADP